MFEKDTLMDVNKIYNAFDLHMMSRAELLDLNVKLGGYIGQNIYYIVADKLYEKGMMSERDMILASNKGRDNLLKLSEESLLMLMEAYGIVPRKVITGDSQEGSYIFDILRLLSKGVYINDVVWAYFKKPNQIIGDLRMVEIKTKYSIGIFSRKGKVTTSNLMFSYIDMDPQPGIPYSYMNVIQLDEIAKDRGIKIKHERGPYSETYYNTAIYTLMDEDEKNPNWANSVKKTQINYTNLKKKRRSVIYYLCGVNLIWIKRLDEVSRRSRNSKNAIRDLLYPALYVMSPRNSMKERKKTKKFTGNIRFLKYAFNKANDGYIFDISAVPKAIHDSVDELNLLSRFPVPYNYGEYRAIASMDTFFLMDVLYENYRNSDILVMSDEELLFYATRKKIMDIEGIDRKKYRRSIIDLDFEFKYRYAELYNYDTYTFDKITNNSLHVTTGTIYSRFPEVPMEKIIYNYADIWNKYERNKYGFVSMEAKNSVRKLAFKIGMLIPIYNTQPSFYFNGNFKHYINVYNRNGLGPNIDVPDLTYLHNNLDIIPDVLSIYTDVEIFDIIGAVIPYYSRNSLIFNIKYALTNEEVFIPIKNNCTKKTYAKNMLIAIGTLTKYNCYNLDKIIQSLSQTSPNNKIILENKGKIRDILRHYIDITYVNNIIHILDK